MISANLSFWDWWLVSLSFWVPYFMLLLFTEYSSLKGEKTQIHVKYTIKIWDEQDYRYTDSNGVSLL